MTGVISENGVFAQSSVTVLSFPWYFSAASDLTQPNCAGMNMACVCSTFLKIVWITCRDARGKSSNAEQNLKKASKLMCASLYGLSSCHSAASAPARPRPDQSGSEERAHSRARTRDIE